MADVVRTRFGQISSKLEKWEPEICMVRLVRDLQAELEEGGMLDDDELEVIHDIVNTFTAKLPHKVREEVREG